MGATGNCLEVVARDGMERWLRRLALRASVDPTYPCRFNILRLVLRRIASQNPRPENDFVDARTDTDLSVDTAIALVLDAEQDALATIAQSEQQADRIMSETRQVIRGMVRHNEERISRLHSGCAERKRRRVPALEATALAEISGPNIKTLSTGLRLLHLPT